MSVGVWNFLSVAAIYVLIAMMAIDFIYMKPRAKKYWAKMRRECVEGILKDLEESPTVLVIDKDSRKDIEQLLQRGTGTLQ